MSSEPELLREEEDEPSSTLLYPDPWHETGSDRASLVEAFGVLLNLLNAVSGPSLLLSPFAFYCAGAVGGAVMLLIAMLLQIVSIYCLVVSAHLSGRASYRGLTTYFIGQNGVLPRVADLLVFLFAMAVCLLHFTVARDVLPFLVAHWVGSEVSPFLLLPLFTLVLLGPALLNRITLYFFPSLVSMICLVYLLIILIYAYATSSIVSGPIDTEPVQLFRWSYQLLESLAIFVFVLTPQLVFFPVVRSLQKGALKRRVTLSLVCGAAGTAAVFYVLIGVFGYLASAAVQRVPLANIVLQFDLKLVVYQTAAVAMLINLVLNFGLFFLSARESLDSLLFGRFKSFVPISDVDAVSVNPNLPQSAAPQPSKKIFLYIRMGLESVFILGSCLVTALFVKEADIDSIAGIGGSSLCVVVCFLLPAVFYWRAWAVPTCSLRQIVVVHGVSLFLVAAGVSIGVCCTIAVLHGLMLV